MLTRRNFQVALYSMAAAMFSQTASSQDDDKVTVRVRADETVRNVLRPIEQHDLSTNQTSPMRQKLSRNARLRVGPSPSC